MKRYRVKLLERAKREYAVALTWWRTYRTGSPNALRDELRAARVLLAGNPEIGRLDEDQGGELRRLFLPTTRYILFYLVDHSAQELKIVALWHASRETADL